MTAGSNKRPSKLTFEQVQTSQTRKTVLLFVLLCSVYFLAFLVFYAVFKYILLMWVFLGSGRSQRLLGPHDLTGVAIFAVVATLAHWFAARSHLKSRLLDLLGATPLDRDDSYHQRFRRIVDELRIAAGLQKIECVVIPTAAMNAFTIDDSRESPVIGVTEGLLSRLKRDELQAVCAHEIAHVLHRDCRLATLVCAMCGMLSAMLDANRGENEKGEEVITPFYPLVTLLYVLALVLNTAISRRREYLADATAVKLTRNPLALVDALKKIARAHRTAAPDGLAPLFITGGDSEEGEGLLSDLLYTHPPMRKRIAVLLGMAGMRSEKGSQSSVGMETRSGERPACSARYRVFDKASSQWTGLLSPAEIVSRNDFSLDTWILPEAGGDPLPAASVPSIKDAVVSYSAGHGKPCPKCGTSLVQERYEGTRIDRCPGCGGCLVEEDRVKRILFRKDVAMGDEARAAARRFKEKTPLRPRGRGRRGESALDSGLPKPRCPVCSREMFTNPYSYQYFVEVDRCLSCGLIWFDRQELEILQVLVEERS